MSLIAHERHYLGLFESAPIGIAIIDLQERVMEANRALEVIVGAMPGSLIGTRLKDLWHPEDQPTGQSTIDRIMSGEITDYSAQKRYRHADGHWVWVQVHARLVSDSDSDGRASHFVSFVYNCTEVKKATEAVRQTADQLNMLFEQSPLGVILLDRDRRYLRTNPAYRRMLGYSEAELASMTIFDTSHPEDLTLTQRVTEALARGEKVPSFEKRNIRKDGSSVQVRIYPSIVETFEDGGDLVMSLVEDITEARAVQEQLEVQRLKTIAASKLATLGEMSSGIAHEINNPLAVIVGNASQLRRFAADPVANQARIIKFADAIERTGMRIAWIIKGLRSFAREGDDDPFTATSIAMIIEETLPLCHSRFKSNAIRLTVRPMPPTIEIECRAVQIAQVLLNLLTNAFDAILPLQERWIEISMTDEGGEIVLRVTDSGPGIPAELRDKIMQPFFTTKEQGKGTGLGLSISSGMIESHGGKLSIDGESRNTCFLIRLPKLQPR